MSDFGWAAVGATVLSLVGVALAIWVDPAGINMAVGCAIAAALFIVMAVLEAIGWPL